MRHRVFNEDGGCTHKMAEATMHHQFPESHDVPAKPWPALVVPAKPWPALVVSATPEYPAKNLTDQRCAGEISSCHAVSSVALANTSSLCCRVGHAARSIEPLLWWHNLFNRECEADVTPHWVLANGFVYPPFWDDLFASPLLSSGQYFDLLSWLWKRSPLFVIHLFVLFEPKCPAQLTSQDIPQWFQFEVNVFEDWEPLS